MSALEDQPITTFVVTDIEADGPSPLASSMLSFASVACDRTGRVIAEFEAVLAPRADREPDPGTMAWWQTQPEAWLAATTNPEPASEVMPRYADFVASLPGQHVFVAAPLIYDGIWIDHYLDSFADSRVFGVPHFARRQIFHGPGVCLHTMAGALRGADYVDWTMRSIPDAWYGGIEHTHRAVDDARGFANVLAKLFEISGQLPGIEATESITT
jgi:hypothetical protein